LGAGQVYFERGDGALGNRHVLIHGPSPRSQSRAFQSRQGKLDLPLAFSKFIAANHHISPLPFSTVSIILQGYRLLIPPSTTSSLPALNADSSEAK
jgi:hypothetical protein